MKIRIQTPLIAVLIGMVLISGCINETSDDGKPQHLYISCNDSYIQIDGVWEDYIKLKILGDYTIRYKNISYHDETDFKIKLNEEVMLLLSKESTVTYNFINISTKEILLKRVSACYPPACDKLKERTNIIHMSVENCSVSTSNRNRM